MTFLPLASQIHFRVLRKGPDHLLHIEPERAAGFNERYPAKVNPVVKRPFGNTQTARELVDIDQHVEFVACGHGAAVGKPGFNSRERNGRMVVCGGHGLLIEQRHNSAKKALRRDSEDAIRVSEECSAKRQMSMPTIGGILAFLQNPGVRSATTRLLIDELVRRSSPEHGAWGFITEQEATEPTVLALLALSRSEHQNLVRLGLGILLRRQLADGQWPAVASLRGGCPWATALAANALLLLSPWNCPLKSALSSLIRSAPSEAFWLYRLKFRMTDTHVRFDPNKYGWGWAPGTISWVIPTAMALIALERSRRMNLVDAKELERRLDLGYAMLLDRMCPGGGWNAGNSVVYNVALAPHIDASAIALSALRRHCRRPEVQQSLAWLLSAHCSSAYSLAWRILATRSYLDVQPDVRTNIEEAREQLMSVIQDLAQLADATTIALALLALRDDINPFAVEPA
jgi:hypothetical protein